MSSSLCPLNGLIFILPMKGTELFIFKSTLAKTIMYILCYNQTLAMFKIET